MPERLPKAFTILTEYHPKSGSSIELTLCRWYLQKGEPQQHFLYASTHLVDFNVSACPGVLSLKKPPRNEEQLVLS